MAVTRVSQSSLKEGLEKANNFLAGFAPLGMDYDSLQTVTVGAGGTGTITFSSIPQTYQHLQLRFLSRTTQSSGSSYSNIIMRVNSDSGANYTQHYLQGDGTSVFAGGGAGATGMSGVYGSNSLSVANVFAANIIDVLDYASTSKNKVFRIFHGYENNGNGSSFDRGFPGLTSHLWINTAAITRIDLTVTGGFNHAQFTVAALYGLRAP